MIDGIIIGVAGGAIAGITVYLIQYTHQKYSDFSEGKRIYNWLRNHTSNKGGEKFRTSRAITSWNNLTQDRVRYLCSINKKIFLSTGDKEDIWGIYDRTLRSVYEDQKIITL
ncbi:MAG: hypothetical protein JXB48_16455 [Candidatus Latescibacteria bacterium]|nr:hypothetical protein [Candidatus Latescibacterota bacterium]